MGLGSESGRCSVRPSLDGCDSDEGFGAECLDAVLCVRARLVGVECGYTSEYVHGYCTSGSDLYLSPVVLDTDSRLLHRVSIPRYAELVAVIPLNSLPLFLTPTYLFRKSSSCPSISSPKPPPRFPSPLADLCTHGSVSTSNKLPRHQSVRQ